MTLDTHLVTTTASDGREVFHELRRLLGAAKQRPIKDALVKNQDYYGSGVRCIEHPVQPGKGLSALLRVWYRPGLEPLRTLEESAAHSEDCEPDCDGTGWAHRLACWVEVSLDTTYGYHGPEGGCGALHARLLFELGQWLDERKIGWGWQNEFTGEWHYEDKYRALKGLIDGGGPATAWFTETIMPLIEATGARLVPDGVERQAMSGTLMSAPLTVQGGMTERYLQILDRPALLRFQGGAVIVQAYGCGACGRSFWIEENKPSESPSVGSTLHCPRCGSAGLVPERAS